MSFFSRPKSAIYSIIKLIRLMYWIPTLQQNLIVSLILIIVSNASINFFFYFIIIQFFMLAYTFVVNDVADKEIDIKAGKIKPIQNFSTKKTALILFSLAGSSLIIPMWFGDWIVKIVSTATFLLLTFYSVKPLRFKERGLWGLIVADGAQRSALFLILGLFVAAQPLLVAFFMVWLFLIGFQDELTHQLMDTDADEKSDAKTWVQQVGYESGKKLLTVLIAASMVFLLTPFLFLDFTIALVISVVLFVFRATMLQFFSDNVFSKKR